MALIGWIIVGVVAALLARTAAGESTVGRLPAWIATGVAGALLGGVTGWLAGLGSGGAVFSAGTWMLALAGALVALGFRLAAMSGALGVPEIRERDVRGHDR